jgi:hypothetical protein
MVFALPVTRVSGARSHSYDSPGIDAPIAIAVTHSRYTGESRCSWQPWFQAFAGKAEGGRAWISCKVLSTRAPDRQRQGRRLVEGMQG